MCIRDSYGFGHFLSHRQSWAQTLLLLAVFVAMAVPLLVSLEQIARESLITNQVRNTLSARFGANARVTQLEIDFDADPLSVRSVIIAPRAEPKSRADLRAKLEQVLGRPVALQVDQVLLTPGAGAIEAQRAELRQSSETAAATRAADTAIAQIVAVTAGIPAERVTLDHDRRRVIATAAVLPGASLATYRVLEQRASAANEGWDVALVPPLGPMPLIRYADGSDVLDNSARGDVLLSAWAAARWNVPALAVPGLPSTIDDTPTLTERRGLAIAALLRERGVRSIAAPAVGPEFRLAAAGGDQQQ